MTKEEIINRPSEWIITRHGDFVKIKDSQKSIDPNLVKVRQHLQVPYQGKIRFQNPTAEQVAKERYDKVLEEVDFDYEKLHDWIYDQENKDKVEIFKLEGLEQQEVLKKIFEYVENSKQKWRVRKTTNRKPFLVHEETGQVIYYQSLPQHFIWDLLFREGREEVVIPLYKEKQPKEKHEASLIFLHGTYGAGTLNQMANQFPHLKIIHPYSPVLQYDMWHGSTPAPGSQAQGWVNVTGDVYELMEQDICPHNSSRINYEEAIHSIHLDYPQLMRAVDYINEIIEEEITSGIPAEKIIIAGYSQGALLTLATALTTKRKLGGFISLCGLLPCHDKLLTITKNQNKTAPILVVNNSGDGWVPFWTGQKSYRILQEQGYNVEFKTYAGLGHAWKDEDVVEFLKKTIFAEIHPPQREYNSFDKWNTAKKLLIVGGIIGIIMLTLYWILNKKKNKLVKSI